MVAQFLLLDFYWINKMKLKKKFRNKKLFNYNKLKKKLLLKKKEKKKKGKFY